MPAEPYEYLMKRIEKLRAENRSLRLRLTSQKKEKNKELKSLKNKNRLLSVLPMGIVLIQDWKIIDINECVLDQSGYMAEELIGRNFIDFLHPTTKAFVQDLYKRRVSGKLVPEEYELYLTAKNGKTLSYEVRVKKIRYNGRRAFVGMLTWIDERKERERQVIEYKKLEATTTMASGMKHELRRYLKELSEKVENMKDLADSNSGGIEVCLEAIESLSGEITSTIKKLDCISKVEENPSGVNHFDLREIVARALAVTRSELMDGTKKTGVKIDLKTYLRPVSPVKGDPAEILNMIINMLLNAVEALPGGGDIYLTTEENAGYVHIYIQDNGMGIPDEIRNRIFDPFFTTKEDIGVGLGLSLCHAIVKRHKGDISVTSEKGEGTTFTIRLPIARQEKKSGDVPTRKKLNNTHILTITDNSILSELLTQLLVSRGIRVFSASNGPEGLNKLKRKGFDLIIADAESLEMDEGALMQKIKIINGNLPVVLIIDHEEGERLEEMNRPNADLIIIKPIDMNRAVKQIIKLLRK
ncbi:MAG: ATP-binding protein [Thermodesulfobacteriota bacterium]|nr:ATP-binding protein [Thermodesulfobacteriota bacterium]